MMKRWGTFTHVSQLSVLSCEHKIMLVTILSGFNNNKFSTTGLSPTFNSAVTLITKSDQFGVNRTKSEIPIIKSGHFTRSYTIGQDGRG